MFKIKEAFGDHEWRLIGPRNQERTVWQLRDGCTYAAMLPGEDQIPELPQKSKFTRQGGRPIVHFKVELGGKTHDLSIKEGDRKGFVEALQSISGAEKIVYPRGQPSLEWQNRLFKVLDSGPECRIPFFLKLQTGEKEFEVVKAFVKDGQSVGLVQKIATWRFGIRDCRILGSPLTVSEEWREKTFTVACRMLGGDPNHISNESRMGGSNQGTPVRNQVFDSPADQGALPGTTMAVSSHEAAMDGADGRGTSCSLGGALDIQRTSIQLDINNECQLGVDTRNQVEGNSEESPSNHETISGTSCRKSPDGREQLGLPATRHDRGFEKAAGRNALTQEAFSRFSDS
jgi:hypothetical protein